MLLRGIRGYVHTLSLRNGTALYLYFNNTFSQLYRGHPGHLCCLLLQDLVQMFAWGKGIGEDMYVANTVSYVIDGVGMSM